MKNWIKILSKEESLMKIIKGLTTEDIENDIELEIVSGFGGMKVGQCKVSEVLEIVKNEERDVNRDYYIVKLD